MSKIQIMDEHLANKIAAGEVVEKCASVVKELVENSIDAESTDIRVDLIEAGTKEIKITDNGYGMDKEDAILAFNRHATSKLKTEKDLYNINTLGFRGEALAAISSVSQIDLITSNGEIGTKVEINGGKIIAVNNAELRKGTIIAVKNLFFNTPARLKHLRSLYAELANITDYIDKLALSHPNISFTLTNNGSTIVKTDGKENLLKVIKEIYGINVAKKMLYIEGENDDYKVDGYISLPEINRSTRNHIVTLVNSRIIRNAELARVINDSYHTFKPDTRYPIVVINISCDPSIIDVNIHPTKMDIKFSKIEELKQLIETLISKKIRQINLIPEVEQIEKVEVKTEYIQFDLSRTEEQEVLYEASVKEEVIEEERSLKEIERLPELLPIGLIHGTYIICQNDKGMYLVDQHAAKERINYEMFKKSLGNPSSSSVELLIPITMEFSNNEFIILKEKLNLLRNLNFEIEEFGINSIIIKSHPTWITEYVEDQIRKIIEIIIEQKTDFSIEKFNEKASIMMSCKKAIKANENITIKEMEHLIDDLRKCDNPFNCPHGRPTIIFFSNYDLEKLFKRSGFETLI